MQANANTTAEQLVRACEIGRAAGLRYIYAGNLPGRVGRWENTYCPTCDELLVEVYWCTAMAADATPVVPSMVAAMASPILFIVR